MADWINHDGKAYPGALFDLVEVERRDGRKIQGLAANMAWRWKSYAMGYDVMAYRVIQAQRIES